MVFFVCVLKKKCKKNNFFLLSKLVDQIEKIFFVKKIVLY
jgi:hypothetical protein